MSNTINLFTLPFAGGNFYSYRAFQAYMPPYIKMQPLEPPGRGRRVTEALLPDLEDMADDALLKLQKYDLSKPYLIYGHSMGGLMGYLLIQRLQQHKIPPPQHFIVSGRRSPDKFYHHTYHTLPPNEFIQWLKTLGGLPQSILDSDELLEFVTPIIQTDFQATETFVYEQRPRTKLQVPITAFYGTDESISEQDMENWHQESTQSVNIEQFEGDHFFIFKPVFLNRFKQLLADCTI
ncbi:thioesterase domain-containing protein [Candidatus Albibeggiatoa sp. nov. NOAA]|uniref:thioesterase II family protein n=1 Tax=Candidatus Albibeggiatoa sp. nov. NOAA TaxID=3162724 RepID=UPI0032F41242|nr:thioesterase domain-containing protein [Thiotrichaceae bacterium]